jgi:hypothetical protein
MATTDGPNAPVGTPAALALVAPASVQLVFGDVRLDHRQLEDLMPIRGCPAILQRSPALLTTIGAERHELVDLVGWNQRALVLRMSRLRALLTPALGLLALGLRMLRVRRRWLARVERAARHQLSQLGNHLGLLRYQRLEPSDARLQLFDPVVSPVARHPFT